jgi:hypothetical protein
MDEIVSSCYDTFILYTNHFLSGVNLRSSQRGIFPCMYATDLEFLEEEEGEDLCLFLFLKSGLNFRFI